MEDLTLRQQQILDFIRQRVQERNYPPSVREIGEAVGLSSSSTVHSQLSKLEKKGYIRRDPTKPRAIELLYSDDPSPSLIPEVKHIPVIGQVAAGSPLLAEQNIEDYYPLPAAMTKGDNYFILRIRGESMINAGINDHDLVIVRQQPTAQNGDIVVALADNEATVKRFFKEKDYIRLQPENDLHEPLRSADISILGKVTGLIREVI